MKRLWIFIGLLALFAGCDRYDHDVYSDAALESSFMIFSDSLSAGGAEDLGGIMTWYSDEYLHNTMTKTDIEHKYEAYYHEYGDSLVLAAELLEYWKTGRIRFELRGMFGEDNFLISEIEDYFMADGGDYLFFGNQVAPPALNPDLPVVLFQYFTSTTCSNCPDVARKLKEMHSDLGEQFVALDYIYDQDPGGVFFPEATYYEAYSQPTIIVQGDYKIIGAGGAALLAYQSRYEQALAEPLQFRFTSLEISVSGNIVTGIVTWEELVSLTGEGLMLRAVLLEEEPDLHYISSSVYFENRVLGGAEQIYDSNLSVGEISVACNIELPEKVSMVVWLQSKGENWNVSGAKIYNVIKGKLGE
jgi:thiol-disulfide isomerase/thioredoxin